MGYMIARKNANKFANKFDYYTIEQQFKNKIIYKYYILFTNYFLTNTEKSKYLELL